MRRLAIIAFAAAILVGCAPTGTGADVQPPLTSFITATTMGGTAHDFGYVLGVGDSMTFQYVPLTVGPIGNAYTNGAGFIWAASGQTIQGGYNYWVTHGGTVPDTIVLMGGTNDLQHSQSFTDIETAIETFTAQRVAAGQHVIHLTQPYYAGVYPDMSTLNTWLINRYPDTIDVATAVIPDGSDDTLHPNTTGAQHLADIVSNHLNL